MNQNENLKIREVNEKDVSTIVEIHRACISQTNAKVYPKNVICEWLQHVSEKNVLDQLSTTGWLLLIKGNRVIGFCQYDLKGSELYQIQISPDYQGKGYGKYFYEFVENDFMKNNKSSISLFATLNAVDFYKSVGFKQIKNVQFPLNNVCAEMIKMAKKFK